MEMINHENVPTFPLPKSQVQFLGESKEES